MQLTRFTDCALRVIIDLALEPSQAKTIEQLARRHRVARNHLSKIVQTLSKLGYVRTLRGKGGGVRIARHPEEICIGALVRQTESLTLVECMGHGNQCPMSRVCALKSILRRSMAAFLAELDRYTLADLVRQPEPLLASLSQTQ